MIPLLIKKIARKSSLLLLSAILAGCAVQPQKLTNQELVSQKEQDLTAMFANREAVDHPLSLSEVIARSLRYNMDHRVKRMEAALATRQLDLDKFDTLPKLTTSAGYSGRDNMNASSSYSVATGAVLPERSTSQDRERITADLGLTWNLLDFGVSYYNAKQNADRQLIAQERERKVLHNLVQESRSAFWRAAAAQQLAPRVAATVKLAESALADAQQAEKSQLRSPLESLRYRKTLLETLRQLEATQQELSTAKVELAAMMTLPPGTPLQLAIPKDGLAVNDWQMPLADMEESALMRQPDMREMAYQSRITATENRKALLKLLPGISINMSHQYDDNSFAMHQEWNEAGIRVSLNLLNLLSAPDQLAFAEANETVTQTKRQALRMALLMQVHIAHRQYEAARTQLQRSEALFRVEKDIAQHTGHKAAQDAQSVLDRIASETNAILAELRYYLALSQLQSAVGKMMATVGQDPEVGTIQEGTLEDLSKRVEQWLQGSSAQKQAASMPNQERSRTENKQAPGTPAQNSHSDLQTKRSSAQNDTSAEADVQSALVSALADANEAMPQTAPRSASTNTQLIGRKGTVQRNTWVRHGPGRKFEKVRLLHPGDPLTVLELSGDGQWLRIGTNAWMNYNMLAPQS
ncbi:TolC family protein [Candidatus Magnetaquicoccus inordinatus]|uniref:TolC family protein n=1 Tax=Candidatus Magnetaquicoccus inordinatus TaxID=2496818 RepID=UPI00102B0972|nr:TolC family protein [Candidatus Magnetaquicoccus inordinatus]